MRDGAPSYTSWCAREEIFLLGIKLIAWPSFSPDLDRIGSVWDQMKAYTNDHHPKQYAGG